MHILSGEAASAEPVDKKPELRRAQKCVVTPPTSHEKKTGSSRRRRSRSDRKHKPACGPSARKLEFQLENDKDSSGPALDSSSGAKPSQAGHLKDPQIKGSSFDSCWRFCAALEQPSPETKPAAPEDKQESSESIPLGYSPGDSHESPHSSHRGSGSSRTNASESGLKRGMTSSTDASSKRSQKFDKMYFRSPSFRL